MPTPSSPNVTLFDSIAAHLHAERAAFAIAHPMFIGSPHPPDELTAHLSGLHV